MESTNCPPRHIKSLLKEQEFLFCLDGYILSNRAEAREEHPKPPHIALKCNMFWKRLEEFIEPFQPLEAAGAMSWTQEDLPAEGDQSAAKKDCSSCVSQNSNVSAGFFHVTLTHFFFQGLLHSHQFRDKNPQAGFLSFYGGREGRNATGEDFLTTCLCCAAAKSIRALPGEQKAATQLKFGTEVPQSSRRGIVPTCSKLIFIITPRNKKWKSGKGGKIPPLISFFCVQKKVSKPAEEDFQAVLTGLPPHLEKNALCLQ